MQNEDDYWTVEAMTKYGGSFIQNLARLAHSADHINLAKIKKTWPEYWQEYATTGEKLKRASELIGENP